MVIININKQLYSYFLFNSIVFIKIKIICKMFMIVTKNFNAYGEAW